MKKYFIFAIAALAMVSCNKEKAALVDAPELNDGTISFGTTLKKVTKANLQDHATSAATLQNNFIVEGVKGDGTHSSYTAAAEVFDHYNVNYTASTANTTESNTKDWEYVGLTAHALSALGTQAQAIKYWDFSKSQYDFVAFSYGTAAKTNVAPAPVLTEIDYTKIGAAVSTGTPVYTIAGSATELAKCYIADLVTVYNDGHSYQSAVVTPTFRNLGTKVRLAFYETVPGYSVKNVKFYNTAYTGGVTTAEGVADATLFATNAIFPAGTSAGTMSVYYPTVGKTNQSNPDYNQAHVVFAAGTGASVLATAKTFGTLNYSGAEGKEAAGNNYLGRTSATATYAGTADYYDMVLPLGTSDNLQLRISYDLVPIDGGAEVIHVSDARAVVPAAYADWKPNYAYTYIFKISNNTNGYTGTTPNPDYDPTDPDSPEFIPEEGLTPITFDAVVVESTDGVQETITTIATPSITTYQQGKVITTNNEYVAGDIYVSVMNAGSVYTLTDSPANYGVYLVTAGADKVDEALAQDMLNGKKSNTGVTWTPAIYEAVSEVPAADGNKLTVSAAKFAAASGKTYVFDVVVNGKNYVKIIKVQ